MPAPLLTRYLQPLLAGRRAECFSLIQDAVAQGAAPRTIFADVVWPAMHQIERLFKDDQINAALENMAARINRTVADQLQARLTRAPRVGQRVLVACGHSVRDEIGAQAIADLLDAEGWDAFLVGAGVPADEILKLTGELRPHLMVIYGTPPHGVPEIRAMIQTIRDINVCPTMNIMVAGGVFNRAEGLWREVAADLHAREIEDVIHIAMQAPPRTPGAPRPGGVVKKRHRRRGVKAGSARRSAPALA